MPIDLSIIIVNWNAGDLLRRCAASIVGSRPAVAYEIIVIDNASDDQSLTLLRSDEAASTLMGEGRLRIVENAENRGFGRANNQAFNLSHAAFVLLLNPDTLMVPGAIESLIELLRSDRRIGACGPRLVNPDGSLQISVWRNPPTAWEIVLSNLKLYRLLPRRIRGELLLGPHWRHDRRRQVRMLSAAALMVRRETIDAVGGFDERFHMYAEDNEWCLRMARAGWLLVFEPAAVVRHDEAQSSLKRWSRLEKRRIQLEASYLFQKVSLPRWHVIANQLASYMTAWAQRAWRLIRGVDAPELALVTRLHGQHLKQALHDTTPRDRRKTAVKSGNQCVLCGADCPISIVTRDLNRGVSQTDFQYRRCERCELLFLSNPPCNLAEHYPAGYVTLPRSLATLQRIAELNRYQLDLLLRFVRPGRLLEIGPGYGSFLWLAKSAGFSVSAIEPDGAACEYLEQTVRANVIRSAAPEQVLESTADEYKAIVLWHALEHLPHPWQTLREASQRLNSGGVIVIATPNPEAWQFRRLGRYWPHIDAPRHLWLIPLEVLRSFLEPLGLTLVFATSGDPGGKSWNRFGWSQAFLNLQPPFLRNTFAAKVVARVLGHVVGFSARPWERAELRGSAYTAVFQKRSLS